MIGNGKGRSCFVAHEIGGGIQNRGRSRKSEVEVGCEVERVRGAGRAELAGWGRRKGRSRRAVNHSRRAGRNRAADSRQWVIWLNHDYDELKY